jgi:predicted transcriptional regulator
MPKKTAIPEQVAQALVMREAGYTVLSISQQLGISLRTLQRYFALHGAKKGSLTQDLLDAARMELMKRIISDEVIREEVAKLVNDDLAHTRHLRSLMLSASEQLQANSLKEAVLVMRAAVAYSTALKNTSDTLRQTMRVERALVGTATEMPELMVREMTQQETEEMRSEQETHLT